VSLSLLPVLIFTPFPLSVFPPKLLPVFLLDHPPLFASPFLRCFLNVPRHFYPSFPFFFSDASLWSVLTFPPPTRLLSAVRRVFLFYFSFFLPRHGTVFTFPWSANFFPDLPFPFCQRSSVCVFFFFFCLVCFVCVAPKEWSSELSKLPPPQFPPRLLYIGKVYPLGGFFFLDCFFSPKVFFVPPSCLSMGSLPPLFCFLSDMPFFFSCPTLIAHQSIPWPPRFFPFFLPRVMLLSALLPPPFGPCLNESPGFSAFLGFCGFPPLLHSLQVLT